MYGVSKITSEQNIMLTTFPGAQYSAKSLAEHLGRVCPRRHRGGYDLPERPPRGGGGFQLYHQLRKLCRRDEGAA